MYMRYVKERLGWKPKYDLEKGLNKMIEWHSNNDVTGKINVEC